MNMRSTYTYTTLAVSHAAYSEIKAKLQAAGYSDQFHEDREDGVLIDMHGLALKDEGELAVNINTSHECKLEERVHLISTQTRTAQQSARLRELDEYVAGYMKGSPLDDRSEFYGILADMAKQRPTDFPEGRAMALKAGYRDYGFHFWKFVHNALVHPLMAGPWPEPKWLNAIHDWTAKRCPGAG